MKKALLFVCLILSFSGSLKSQSQSPSFFANIFYADYICTQDSAYRLGCGITTRVKDGYVSFGYNNHISNSLNSFFCNKNFAITGYGDSFLWKGYEIFDANDCSGSLTKVQDCRGITAVEVNRPNIQRYAIAGAYSKAVFLATVDSIGNAISSTSYPFPHLTSPGKPLPSKPIIISSSVQNQYYICGSFESYMYILNVNLNGSIIWSKYYSSENGISPKDLIIDPYQNNKLVIVGSILDNANEKNAFFMRVDALNGTVVDNKLFGFNDNEEEFRSVIAGAYIEPNNSQGYVLAGYSETSSSSVGQGNAWVLKLDVTGNILWNRLLTPFSGTNTGCVDITQRLNTFNNYEYYALISASTGMQVAKLEDNGVPFQFFNPNGLDNEFTYQRMSSTCVPVNIDYVNTTSSWNLTGIQVYGTLFVYNTYANTNGSYCLGAYFNGKTNCSGTYNKIVTYQEGPQFLKQTSVGFFGSFDKCTNFLVTDSYAGIISAYQCGGLIPSGSNLRTAPNGDPLNLIEDEEKTAGVFPNPVITKTSVNYYSKDYSKVFIELLDITGRRIWSIEPTAKIEGTYSEEIDFENLQVKSGIYFVSTTVDGKASKVKLVYTK